MQNDNQQSTQQNENLKFWLEFGLKVITGVILVIIPFFIKNASDDISKSIQTAELTKKLIEDLTAKNEKTRRDIALIALDDAVGDDKPEMLSKISKMLLEDDETTGVAYDIFQKRTPLGERQAVVKRWVDKSPTLALKTISNDTNTKTFVSELPRNLIYIQFLKDETNKNKDLAKDLQIFLKDQGYFAPGFEQINIRNTYFPSNNTIEIRYFNDVDKPLVDGLVDKLKEFCVKNCSNIIKDNSITIKKSNLKAQDGQLEIWFDINNP